MAAPGSMPRRESHDMRDYRAIHPRSCAPVLPALRLSCFHLCRIMPAPPRAGHHLGGGYERFAWAHCRLAVAGRLPRKLARRSAKTGVVPSSCSTRATCFKARWNRTWPKVRPWSRAYNALGYSAVAIGNHEFDFGPAGPAPSPVETRRRSARRTQGARRRGPLSLLCGNVVDKKTGKPVAWPNVQAFDDHQVAGIKIGLVGAVTAATPYTALPANVAGLEFLPLANRPSPRSAQAACHGRQGRHCRGSRRRRVHRFLAIPKGSIPAMPKARSSPSRAGCPRARRHRGRPHPPAVAQRVAGVPIIQSYCNGRAFGRVDLTVDRKSGKVIASHLEEPHDLCQAGSAESCNRATTRVARCMRATRWPS